MGRSVRFSKDEAREAIRSSRSSIKHKGAARPERRKVDRPSLDQLKLDIEELGYVGTGRKYGVSDNAVRKWITWYSNGGGSAAA